MAQITLLTSQYGNIRINFTEQEFDLEEEDFYIDVLASYGGLDKHIKWTFSKGNVTFPSARVGNVTQPAVPSPMGNVTVDDVLMSLSTDCAIYSSGLTNGVLAINEGTMGNHFNFYNGTTFAMSQKGLVSDAPLDLIIVVSANFPIFAQNNVQISGSDAWTIDPIAPDEQCVTKINNGTDMSVINRAINFNSMSGSIPRNQVWHIANYLKINSVITTTKNYDFRILPDAKIGFVLHNQIEGDATGNMTLYITEAPWQQKAGNAPDDAYVDTFNLDSEYWWGTWQNYNTGTQYIGYGSTNIPIFEDEQTWLDYVNGVVGIDASINGGDSSIQTSSIGEQLTETQIPTVNLASSGIGCFAYALSEANLKEIMEDYLFTDDTNLRDTMKEALWQWGNNPIDFLIDCYYIPFSITPFYDTITTNLKFGTYQFPNTSYSAIKETNGNRLTLFNTTFEGVYGDWRDYTQFTYDLFLPFIGFVTLDVQKYLYHNVKCEMMFDISTHNLRYYLFVDGLITDRFDGSVGVNIPLMATDIVNKAKHDRELKYGIASDMLGVVGSGLSIDMGSKDAVGDVLGGINNIISGIKKYQELSASPTSHVEGGFSSSMNVYDITYAYLRITEKQMIIPSKMHSLYGYPSYYMGTIDNLSGYCEIDDIQLKSNCTEYEYNEIMNLLKGGVIL